PFKGVEDARVRLELLEIDPAQVTSADRARIEQALAARPEDPVALVRIGAIHERAGDLPAAAEAYLGALKSNSENVGAMLRLIDLRLKQNDGQKALELARNARRLAPENAAVTHALGRAAYATGDFRWSYSLLQEAARKLNR